MANNITEELPIVFYDQSDHVKLGQEQHRCRNWPICASEHAGFVFEGNLIYGGLGE
jgi:hypothetical protein